MATFCGKVKQEAAVEIFGKDQFAWRFSPTFSVFIKTANAWQRNDFPFTFLYCDIDIYFILSIKSISKCPK